MPTVPDNHSKPIVEQPTSRWIPWDSHGRKNIVHLDEWRKSMFHKLGFLAEGIPFLFTTIYQILLLASDMAMKIKIEDTRDTTKDVHFVSENNET